MENNTYKDDDLNTVIKVKKSAGFRKILPKSLFGRALLILVLPTILIQIFAMYFFYERHWASVARNMSLSLSGDVALLVHKMHFANDDDREEWTVLAEHLMGLKISFSDDNKNIINENTQLIDSRFNDFYSTLKNRIGLPVFISQKQNGGNIIIDIMLLDDLMHIEVARKRLVNPTTYIFPLWIASISTLLLIVAILFLRNQIKPIAKLAKAAEKFGMGDDAQGFIPSGASEVRRAGRAFLIMRSRIKKQIATRTAMLSAISHDLRTPLTRMKLQLAMIKNNDNQKNIEYLEEDVSDMQHMIAEYLDYAVGIENKENIEKVELIEFIKKILHRLPENNDNAKLIATDKSLIYVSIRPKTFKRAIDNIISNALRYGGNACEISLLQKQKHVEINFDDKGNGIDESLQEDVFRPFTRLDESRNAETGGVGLGLTIARDIILTHGGSITLTNIKNTNDKISGLRVIIKLPLIT